MSAAIGGGTVPAQPTTGFAKSHKLRLVELTGLALIGSGIWTLICDHQMYGGSALVAFGIDVIVRPNARRMPDTNRIADFVLSFRASSGSSRDINDPRPASKMGRNVSRTD